jgi:hypothetical protein
MASAPPLRPVDAAEVDDALLLLGYAGKPVSMQWGPKWVKMLDARDMSAVTLLVACKVR